MLGELGKLGGRRYGRQHRLQQPYSLLPARRRRQQRCENGSPPYRSTWPPCTPPPAGPTRPTSPTRVPPPPIYVYDPLVLLILLVPFLATLLGATWGGWWRVAGEDVTIGYEPAAIARLVPVVGLPSGAAHEERLVREAEDDLRLWGRRQGYVDQDRVVFKGTGLQMTAAAHQQPHHQRHQEAVPQQYYQEDQYYQGRGV
ncbi:hypothetical protein DL770_009864 [Monosporascus sp. CRB-9-2]|nr:hypothetical protein DL770_009864 [Monosporascus sp. CRB-9-2]